MGSALASRTSSNHIVREGWRPGPTESGARAQGPV